jgi:hypothetical protein
MKTGQVIIDARKDQEWLDKAKGALAKLRPLQLTGDEQQIAEFLQYKCKCAKARKWKTEGTLTIEPPIEL